MKRFILDQEQHGKLFLIGMSVLIWSVILVLFNVYGYRETWELWRVPVARHVFLDFQLIPGSAESFRNGFEPTIENPSDPAGRIFNYPAFWRLFFYTGITIEDTIWIGVCMNMLFLAGVFLFPKKISIITAIGMLLVIFSPASMLLYERGNVDLIVFFLCALILVVAEHSSTFTALLIALGTFVKFFPFFGITVLLKEGKKKFWLLFAGCFTVLVGYMISTLNSVNAAWNLTMREAEKSYGANVFVTRFELVISRVFSQWLSSTQIDGLVKYGSQAAGLLLLLLITVLALKSSWRLEMTTESNLAAFRMGASVYIGTFMLGNNFDYRLAFLVLLVPQLFDWMRSSDKRVRYMAWACGAAVYISCWHFVPWHSPFFEESYDRLKALFIFDDMVNWTLMAGLAYFLIASVPDWLKDQVLGILSGRSTSVSNPT